MNNTLSAPSAQAPPAFDREARLGLFEGVEAAVARRWKNDDTVSQRLVGPGNKQLRWSDKWMAFGEAYDLCRSLQQDGREDAAVAIRIAAPVVMVEFDGGYNPTDRTVDADVARQLSELGCYAEVAEDGTTVRAILRGDVPGWFTEKTRRAGSVTLTRAGGTTLTFRSLPGSGSLDGQAEGLTRLLKSVMKDRDVAWRLERDPLVKHLWMGGTGGNRTGAERDLARAIVRYTGRDLAEGKRVFRRSGLAAGLSDRKAAYLHKVFKDAVEHVLGPAAVPPPRNAPSAARLELEQLLRRVRSGDRSAAFEGDRVLKAVGALDEGLPALRAWWARETGRTSEEVKKGVKGAKVPKTLGVTWAKERAKNKAADGRLAVLMEFARSLSAASADREFYLARQETANLLGVSVRTFYRLRTQLIERGHLVECGRWGLDQCEKFRWSDKARPVPGDPPHPGEIGPSPCAPSPVEVETPVHTRHEAADSNVVSC